MASLKFINLLAISSLAVLACSFGATPVTALATANHHIRDIPAHGHGAIAKRKRHANSNHCKQRPTSSSSAKPTADAYASPKSSSKPTANAYASPKPSPKPSPKSSLDNKASSAPASTTHSSSSSAKPAATAALSGTGSGGGGKVGLAWANGPSMSIKPFVTKDVSYVYTWSPDIYPNAASFGLRNMPMLWGDDQTSDFTKLVKKGYADAVMGFNEPNEPGQSNMTPEHGASLWKQYIQPLDALGYTTMVAPATSSNPNGKVWVQNFMTACNGGCKPTHSGVHYYDITAAGFISYMEDWHNTFGLPVMPTEFACQNFNDANAQCSAQEVDDFMTTAIDFMESTSWITAYFAFGVMQNMQGVNTLNQLMNSAGQPTALGLKYINGQ